MKYKNRKAEKSREERVAIEKVEAFHDMMDDRKAEEKYRDANYERRSNLSILEDLISNMEDGNA